MILLAYQSSEGIFSIVEAVNTNSFEIKPAKYMTGHHVVPSFLNSKIGLSLIQTKS